MKNARAGHTKLSFFPTKYANLYDVNEMDNLNLPDKNVFYEFSLNKVISCDLKLFSTGVEVTFKKIVTRTFWTTGN